MSLGYSIVHNITLRNVGLEYLALDLLKI
jgi:hypothetical protein